MISAKMCMDIPSVATRKLVKCIPSSVPLNSLFHSVPFPPPSSILPPPISGRRKRGLNFTHKVIGPTSCPLSPRERARERVEEEDNYLKFFIPTI